MRTIYKYPLNTTDLQTIKVPRLPNTNSFKEQFLCIDIQYGLPCLWCMVDTSKEEREIQIRIVGTGNPMPDSCYKENYLGSYQLLDGQFVGHVFLEGGE